MKIWAPKAFLNAGGVNFLAYIQIASLYSDLLAHFSVLDFLIPLLLLSLSSLFLMLTL